MEFGNQGIAVAWLWLHRDMTRVAGNKYNSIGSVHFKHIIVGSDPCALACCLKFHMFWKHTAACASHFCDISEDIAQRYATIQQTNRSQDPLFPASQKAAHVQLEALIHCRWASESASSCFYVVLLLQ